MTTDPITEARRVLETGQNLPLPVQVAFSNLLTHVERLTAPVTGDRAELAGWFRHYAGTGFYGRDTMPRFAAAAAMLEADARRAPATGDRAELVKRLRDRVGNLVQSNGEIVETVDYDAWEAADMLEADAVLVEIAAAGMVLVPREPLPEMLGAFWLVKNTGSAVPGETGDDRSDYAAYRAMLSAAPSGGE